VRIQCLFHDKVVDKLMMMDQRAQEELRMAVNYNQILTEHKYYGERSPAENVTSRWRLFWYIVST